MFSIIPRQANAILNKNHENGFRPLHIRAEHDGHVMSVSTAWEPTPKELEMLNAGGHIEVSLMTTNHPPIIVGAVSATDPVSRTTHDEVRAKAVNLVENLADFYRQVMDEQTAHRIGQGEYPSEPPKDTDAYQWALENHTKVRDIIQVMRLL